MPIFDEVFGILSGLDRTRLRVSGCLGTYEMLVSCIGPSRPLKKMRENSVELHAYDLQPDRVYLIAFPVFLDCDG